ncbi:mannosyltransferase putative-domain-containing protein [Aspergillus californicus]
MLASRRTILAYFAVAFLFLNIFYSWASLWQQLHPLLEEHKPDCPPPILHGSAGLHRFDAINESPRQNHVSNADEIRLPMQAAHDGFVKAICNLRIDRTYAPGTTGIVSSAGGTYLPTFLVSVLLLRRTGSTLPVELFMKDRTEYEPSICEDIFPPLGVKCVVLSDILAGQNSTETMDTIQGFQIKSFAILFSSFEDLLWLDADCVPLDDPTALFNSEPFTSIGMVTWPDFWANTAAPVYFDISHQAEPLSTSRQATEAGIIFINKATHSLTLILAAYYNYHGPDYYYTLLGQGAPGAGDKDTFLHAASALNEAFYAVSETLVDIGNVKPWDSQVAINAGYVQADPIQDYNLTSQGKWRVKESGPSTIKPPRALFIHEGDPEFNPGKDLLGDKLKGFDGPPTRLWTHPAEAIERLGYDAEKTFWEETVHVVCEMQPAFESWKDKSLESLCQNVKSHWRAVFETADVKSPDAEEQIELVQ